MTTPFLGEIQLFSFNFPPRGWALCNGQVLPINQNQALFALLGTTYGGNGTTNFALPNLQGRVPIHVGNNISLGQQAGEENHTLTLSEMPSHNHSVIATTDAANSKDAHKARWGVTNVSSYHSTPNISMHPGSLTVTGGSQPHTNMQPYLVMNYCIALNGIFPSRN